MGNSHPDTQAFDDTSMASPYTRIAEVKGWFNQFCVGFEVVYETNGQRHPVRHVGGDTSNAMNVTLTLDPDEYISGVSGHAGNIIDSLTIRTSKNKSATFGGQGGNPFDF